MIKQSVYFHPKAKEEAEATVNWYLKHSARAAERFLDELSRCVEAASRHPKLGSSSDDNMRRLLLRKFPYVLVFRESLSGIEILAVAHGRRKPGYWRDRKE